MTYILIVLWFGASTSWSGKAALAVEFNDLESCRVAATEIQRQANSNTREIGTIMCAAKGKQK